MDTFTRLQIVPDTRFYSGMNSAYVIWYTWKPHGKQLRKQSKWLVWGVPKIFYKFYYSCASIAGPASC